MPSVVVVLRAADKVSDEKQAQFFKKQGCRCWVDSSNVILSCLLRIESMHTANAFGFTEYFETWDGFLETFWMLQRRFCI